jgi:hypothetical protein
MKSILTTALLTMSCLTAYTHASAQAATQARIPFKFTVGQKVLPPGTYTIREVASTMIEIENQEKGGTLHFFTYSSDCVKGKTNMLVFSKHGDQYFLREVRGGSGEYAEDLRPSKLEQEIQLQETARANQQSVEISMNKK